MGFLICFTGMDGSGKTTNARLLTSWMKSQNVEADYVWNMLEAPLLKPLTLLASLLLLRTNHVLADYSKYTRSKKYALRNPLLLKAYINLLVFDLLIRVLFKVYLRLLLGRVVVCDRYVFDLIATMMADLELPLQRILSIIQIPLKAFPRPEITFLMDVPEAVALTRKCDIPSIEFLKRRRQAYLTIGRKFKMVILNGSDKLKDLHITVRGTLEEAIVTSNSERAAREQRTQG